MTATINKELHTYRFDELYQNFHQGNTLTTEDLEFLLQGFEEVVGACIGKGLLFRSTYNISVSTMNTIQDILDARAEDSAQNKPRYFVDDRVGCVAVRDSTLVDEDEQGLSSTSSGVVHFRMGKLVGTGTSGLWVVPEEYLTDIKNLCRKLNLEDANNE